MKTKVIVADREPDVAPKFEDLEIGTAFEYKTDNSSFRGIGLKTSRYGWIYLSIGLYARGSFAIDNVEKFDARTITRIFDTLTLA